MLEFEVWDLVLQVYAQLESQRFTNFKQYHEESMRATMHTMYGCMRVTMRSLSYVRVCGAVERRMTSAPHAIE